MIKCKDYIHMLAVSRDGAVQRDKMAMMVPYLYTEETYQLVVLSRAPTNFNFFINNFWYMDHFH